MFATLLGALPEPPSSPDSAPPARLATIVAAQVEAGLEPVTDGRPAAEPDDRTVQRWQATALAAGQVASKAVLLGPWSGALAARDPLHRSRPSDADVLARAEHAREVVDALAAAGCPLVEIAEPGACRIGEDEAARALFRAAHLRLADGVGPIHLSISIIGGSAWEAGATTILDPPYHSLAVDLIAGPENWRLVAAAPQERGIVVGVIETGEKADEGPELPVWAAHYAASTKGRGLARVGIGTAGGLDHLPWSAAVRRLAALGTTARIAGLPAGDLADHLDAQAISARTAALGHGARGRPRP